MKAMAKKFLLMLLLAATCDATALHAQRQGIKNLPYVDQRRWHYGFFLGITMADINLLHTGATLDDGSTWQAEAPTCNPSFCVGLMGDLAFTEHLNLRCSPAFYFLTRDITFRNSLSGETKNQNLKSSYLELPLSLKFSAHRLNNYRPYILGGVSVLYDMTHEEETPLVFKRFDFGLHVALGCDTYLPFFKFIPEIRFNIGLADLVDHKRKGLKDEAMRQYTDAIRSAKNKSVSLIFYFE